jgi:hypothetical protein
MFLMIMKNKIGIFGDSFASKDISSVHSLDDKDKQPWCITLANQLRLPYDVIALSGTSIWWSFQNFLENYKNYSHIVFVYSQHNRWHHVDKSLEGMNWVIGTREYNDSHFNSDYKRKNIGLLSSCYHLVNDEKFDIFVLQQIFTKVNIICREHNIKLMNIFPFFMYGIELVEDCESHGSIIYNMVDYTQEKVGLSIDELKIFEQMLFIGDLRPCHLSSERNHMLAKIIVDNFDLKNIINFKKECENQIGNIEHPSIRKILDYFKKFYTV